MMNTSLSTSECGDHDAYDNDRGCGCDPYTGRGCDRSCQNPSCALKRAPRHSSVLEMGERTRKSRLVVEMGVGGMTCSMCSDAVKKALMTVPGITNVSVSLATNMARIEYESTSPGLTPRSIADEIEAIGYDITEITSLSSPLTPRADATSSSIDVNNTRPQKTVELAVGGMTCSMCSSAVQRALLGMKGVVSVHVSLSTNIARIEYEESKESNPDAFREMVEDIGYDVNDVIVVEVAANNEKTSNTVPRRKIVELAVGGMTCSMCSSAVQKALIGMKGVISVNVSLSTNIARIEYEDSEESNLDAFQEMVEDIGYDVGDVMVISDEENPSFTSNGTTEVEEESKDRLGRILRQQDGQLRARRRDFLWSFSGALPILTITMIIPRLFQPTHCVRQFLEGEMHVLGRTLIVQAVIVWVLTTPVQFVCGYSFYKTSFHGIKRGVLGMDVLVALGTTASYLYAFMSMLAADEGYRFFETSAVLICFVLLGKWMSAMAVLRTSEALTQLMKLQARTAIKITSENPKNGMGLWNPLKDSYSEQVVPIQSIHPGDIVKILKGASIPADGFVLHGELTVDQSMITGESIPVLKVPGDEVLGGTICSETGTTTEGTKDSLTAAAFVRVTGVGADSALSRIVQLVQEAQSRQVPLQNLADGIASVFVPVVVCLSMLTFLLWYSCCVMGIVPAAWHIGESPMAFSLLFGIACLVISCPCALGLATPTAVMVGTGVGANHGILMKGGEKIEVASKVDVVVFDKTGTLTKGKPAVTDYTRVVSDKFLHKFMGPLDGSLDVDDYLIWCLGSLERNSEHVLATAVVKYAEQNVEHLLETKPFTQPSNFVALTGRGASGIIDGNVTIAIGNRAFAERESMQISPEVENCMQQLEMEGKTAIVAGINGTVCAVLGIADELKDEAYESVQYLKRMGMDVWMVTGDSKRTAAAIARQLDMPTDRVIAEALPSSKVDHVRKLQSEGRIVAMVGDGVNDSPALAEANVGISMGTGAEIATEASDMVLVSGKVSGTCTALHLSRVIFRRIQWNFLFSIIYNVLSIPLASGVFFPVLHTRLPPTVAAMAMALSSISVVFSSLALRLYTPPDVHAPASKWGRVITDSSSTIQHSPVTQVTREWPPRKILLLGGGARGPGSLQEYEAISQSWSEDSTDVFMEEIEFRDEIV